MYCYNFTTSRHTCMQPNRQLSYQLRIRTNAMLQAGLVTRHVSRCISTTATSAKVQFVLPNNRYGMVCIHETGCFDSSQLLPQLAPINNKHIPSKAGLLLAKHSKSDAVNSLRASKSQARPLRTLNPCLVPRHWAVGPAAHATTH